MTEQTAPTPQPLTEAQIAAIAAQVDKEAPPGMWTVAMVRAIEAAHGIGDDSA